jgi:hypothetical protein
LYLLFRGSSVAFLPRSGVVEGPLAAFGGSDGVIRVLSMTLWQVSKLSFQKPQDLFCGVSQQVPCLHQVHDRSIIFHIDAHKYILMSLVLMHKGIT